jgi:hypothetical protein
MKLFFYLYLRQKRNIIQWLAKYGFRNQYMSEKSAESLFNTAASFIFAVAIYYLTNR